VLADEEATEAGRLPPAKVARPCLKTQEKQKDWRCCPVVQHLFTTVQQSGKMKETKGMMSIESPLVGST
jgi:hypothetical protein